MKNEYRNEVHLAGMVKSCRVSDGGVVDMDIETVHPKPGVRTVGSLADCTYMRHHVRIADPGEKAALFRGFAEASSDGGIREMIPCVVEGKVASFGEDSFVSCMKDGFAVTEKLSVSGNNHAEIEGEVVSASATDEYATLKVRTGGASLNSFIPRSASSAAWEMVSKGRLGRGDRVSLSGPMNSRTFVNGSDTLRMAVMLPKNVTKLQKRLDKTETRGPSL